MVLKEHRFKYHMRQLWQFISIALLLLLTACATQDVDVLDTRSKVAVLSELGKLGYTIQVGAFSNIDNAVRLTNSLENKGLDAYYFLYKTGLYKVRFGDFPTKELAKRRAENLRIDGIIDEFYIVKPESYAVAQLGKRGQGYFRDKLVGTAESFMGIPYKWGGSSVEDGFDCSGLTMAVYHLNGLKLPRNSRSQYRAGMPVKKSELKKGDLVFFATKGGKRISHVGIYAGNNVFIHAPRTGKKIRRSSLSKGYFKDRYVGARTYMRPEG
ncbi:MAG: C40 family peptidase [Candidatus Margulisbacteria bacterium]|nr:C40 family peptidase [Candidatus Margulisiibacteriota bacterium]